MFAVHTVGNMLLYIWCLVRDVRVVQVLYKAIMRFPAHERAWDTPYQMLGCEQANRHSDGLMYDPASPQTQELQTQTTIS